MHRRIVIGLFVQGGVLDVFGNVDQHRAGPASRSDMKRLFDDPRKIGDIGHQIVVFGNRTTDFDDRRFLECVRADHSRRDLSGDGDHGATVEFGVGESGDQIRGSGAAGGDTDPHPSGTAGITLGRECPPLFVPWQDRPQFIGSHRERLVNRHAGPARIREDHVHPLANQGFDKNVGAVNLLGSLSCGSCCRHGGVSWILTCKTPSPSAERVAAKIVTTSARFDDENADEVRRIFASKLLGRFNWDTPKNGTSPR